MTNDQALRIALGHHQAGRLAEAEAIYRQVLAQAPDHPDALNLLGALACQTGHSDAAVDLIGRAIAANPHVADYHFNLGEAHRRAGALDQASAAFRRAIAENPALAEAHGNLATVLTDQGCLDAALASLRTALTLRPSHRIAASQMLHLMHYHPGYDARAILEAHQEWARRFAAPLAAAIPPHELDRSPGRRLRVGFVSASFYNCAQGQMIQPLFRHHDRGQYEFIAYSDTCVPDAVTAVLQAMVDGWRETGRLSQGALAELVRAERVDILVDLALHTANSRLLVFARKPAPVQVTMLELISTTGLTTIDYRLTDRYLDPPGTTDGDYTEQSIRLPDCVWCYQPADGAPPVDELPALRDGFVTFGCQNHYVKLNRPTAELWAAVLRAVPTARILIYSPSAIQREAIRQVFDEAGVARDRVAFLPRVDHTRYIERYRAFDIGLDTQPYAGGTTTQDALWMGVPVITLAGRTAVGRGGVSILSNVGLPELIARSPQQYVDIAVRLAGDLPRLAHLRAGLRARMMASPLMDGPRYAAAVQAAFRRMWHCWCDAG